MSMMMKLGAVYLFIISLGIMAPAMAITTRNTGARSATASPNAAYNYNYMYPYMNNQMRTDLNPGVTPEQGSNPINVITRTEQLAPARRVVSRSAARSATAGPSTTSARAATPSATARRVVPRAARTNTAMRTARGDGVSVTNSDRVDSSATVRQAESAIAATGTSLPSTRCLADYTECTENVVLAFVGRK